VKAPFTTINTIVAVSAGTIVLMGYLVPGLDFLSNTLLHWAVVLAGFALIVGVINLLSVHWGKLKAKKSAGIPSLFLILSFIITLLITGIPLPGLTGTDSPAALWLLRFIQIPVEASLLALLAVTLVVGIVRFLQRRQDGMALIFVVTVVVVLLGSVPIYMIGQLSLFSGLHNWLATVLAGAGVRGLLIGIALGTIAAGLRILMGADRPYGG
jgi:small-conductance mechanosensitive channel